MRVVEVDKSKCLICEVSCHQKGLTFFRFPEEESRLKMWIKEISPLLDILKIQPSSLKENGRICARHFREKDFINRKQNSLVRNACPSLSVSNLNINFQKKIDLNEEIFGEEEILEGDQSNDRNERDIFQCGRCKIQFEILSDFMDHKRYQCQPAIAKSVKRPQHRSKQLQPNGPLPLKNVFVNRFDNHPTESLEQENKSSEHIVKIINEEPSGDKIFSLVMNGNKLVVDDPVDVTTLPSQVLSTPNLPFNCHYNGVVKLGENNPIDLSLAGQVIVFPQTPMDSSVLVNNMDNETQVSSLIITSNGGNCLNGGIVYTCPFQGGNGVLISSASAASQLVLTADTPNSAKDVSDIDDKVTYCELTSAIQSSPETSMLDVPQEGEKVGVEMTSQAEANEFEKTKTRLPCSFCGKVFEKAFNLQQHERIHTGERPFQCIICGRAFTQKSHVRKHMMRHKVWPKAQQTLKLRTQSVEYNGELREKIDYSCQYCSLSFKSYAEHKKHLAVHSNIKVYRCIQKSCNETFGDLDEFLFHSKMHSSAEFQCHICLKVFTNLEELGVHQYDHDTTEKEKRKETGIKLKCKVCHARFKTTESLKNHLAVETHHYECFHCKSVFCSERFLRRHLLIHINSSQSKFKCQNCKKTFRTQQNLRNHAFVHSKEKPFTCDHCDKQFGFKYRLKRHLAIHLNQFLECPFKKHLGCDKTFYRKDKLRDHVTTHSHCKLRSCRMCLKLYWTLSKLHQNIKRDHKTGKNVGKDVLKCFACSQTFRKHKQLMDHHCTVEGRKSKKRERNSDDGGKEESSEIVSNIEIIMVPFGTNGRNLT